MITLVMIVEKLMALFNFIKEANGFELKCLYKELICT